MEAKCDLIAIETIPSIKEARAIVKLLGEFPDAKAWLSFSAKDETSICNGDQFSDAYTEFSKNDQLVAIGINCTYPKLIAPLLQTIKCDANLLPKPFVVYTNNEDER